MSEWRPWQVEGAQYFGKHDRHETVNVYGGYRYNAARGGNGMVEPGIWDPIIRAIPAEGTVERASWQQSPQVKFWLDQPKKTVWQRFMDWLNR